MFAPIISLLLALLASQSPTRGSEGMPETRLHAAVSDDRRACSAPVVSIYRDDPAPCDVQSGQRLDVYGITLAACDDAGGRYVQLPAATRCQGVDY